MKLFMPRQLNLQVASAAEGGWALTLSDGGAPPALGVVTSEIVQAVTAASAAGRPEEVGALLGQALARCPSVLAGVYTALGSARERHEPTVLLIVCEDEALQNLPWERCVDPSGALWEAREPLCIVRRLPQTTAVAAQAHVELRLGWWSAAADGPPCVPLAELCLKLGLAEPRSFVRPAEAELLNAPDTARALHMEAPALDDALPPSLRAVLPNMTVVMVHGEQRSWSAGASRLLSAGAGAVLSGLPNDPDLAYKLLERLYRGLLSVAGLAEAVKDVRVALPELAGGLILAVADGAALRGGVIRERWTPQGWPRPSAEVGALLQGALELSQQLASGFVGLEHIVLSLCRPAPGGRAAERLRFMLSMRRDGVRERLGSYDLLAPEHAETLGTPRLRALGARLEPGFELEALWALIRDDVAALLNATARLPPASDSTLMSDNGERVSSQSAPRAALAMHLEVLGGPEDGRLLRLSAGDELGRAAADSAAKHTLYGETALTDRHLSRRQLRWRGPGEVELLARARELRRPGGFEPLSAGTAQIFVGDVLALTRVTWLRGVSD